MGTIAASDNEFPKVIFVEGAAPGTPPAGMVYVYSKAAGTLFSKDDAGVETDYSSAAASIAAHLADASDAHDASAISVDPTGLSHVAGTEAQTAIEELDAAISGASALTDHTHATTGSGANGGGNAIDLNAGSLRVPVGTGSLTTTEGYVGWQSTTERVRIYDGQRERAVGSQGWAPIALPAVFNPSAAFTSSETLAANGGSMAIPMIVPAHMLLQRAVVRNRDTASARAWEWRLFQQYLNNGNSGENTLAEVSGANGSESFTASAVSSRVANAASAPVYLAPGVYWLVVRNTHASNTFAVAMTASSSEFTPSQYQTKTLGSALGSTLDFVAATWTKSSNMPAVRLDGRVFGETAQY